MKGFLIPLSSYILIILFTYDFVDITAGENVKIDDIRDDNGDSEESKDESLDITVENDSAVSNCSRRTNSVIHEIKTAKPGQFPFIAAVMSHQNVYLCSGSVVSKGLILTTAQCAQKPVGYVLLNATKDKKEETAFKLQVINTDKFPTYMAGSASKDVGLIYVEKHNSTVASKITLSNYTSSSEIEEMEALGYGLNVVNGQPKELQYVGLKPGESFEPEIMTGYFDCIATKVLTCFKDTGGPVIFDDELIGIVIKGQDSCTKEMSGTYEVKKRMADIIPTYIFKAWIDEKIKLNEEQEQSPLTVYPARPVAREKTEKHKMTSKKNAAPPNIPSTSLVITLFLVMLLPMV